MLLTTDDTIVAIASAPGAGARGIIRISGPTVVQVLARCFRSRSENQNHGDSHPPLSEVRQASVIRGEVLLDGFASLLPCELYLWPGKQSYTRQPAAELHTIGSPPLLAALVRTLGQAGARMAEPGEFTLRAFLAGRMDLTQAEAVLGVIDAQSETGFRVALAQLAGGLATPLHKLRSQLVDLLADLEASLDFVEEDIEFVSRDTLDRQLTAGIEELTRLSQQLTARHESTGAATAVLIGLPNTGKSSLFNVLAPGAVALVSPQAGTTRDYLAAEIELDGVKCRLIDTAGAEEQADDNTAPVAEKLAQDHARQQAGQAQVRLLCVESGRPLGDWELDQIAAMRAAQDQPSVLVLTKCDLPVTDWSLPVNAAPFPIVRTSVRTFQGLVELRQAICAAIQSSTLGEQSGVAATAARCGQSLLTARQALEAARQAARQHHGEELIAAELRGALVELGRVVGAVFTDEILDRIFRRFCIGK